MLVLNLYDELLPKESGQLANMKPQKLLFLAKKAMVEWCSSLKT